MKPITENQIEEYAIAELGRLGWGYVYGTVISPGGDGPERESYEQVLLLGRLRAAVEKINRHIPEHAR